MDTGMIVKEGVERRKVRLPNKWHSVWLFAWISIHFAYYFNADYE